MPNKKISDEEAEQSATEWMGSEKSLMRDCLVDALKDPKQHRDIGKILCYPAEIIVNKFIEQKTGRKIKKISGESYDGITNDDKQQVKHQTKFRQGDWHLETTRRNSKKNEDTNSTGHVVYREGEFGPLFVFIPGPTFGITGSKIRAIPSNVLINPEKPDQLLPRIPAKIRKIYDDDEKTDEVIREYYQTPSSPQD